jgi:RimJ/RimL family protein N-acetyltransferase
MSFLFTNPYIHKLNDDVKFNAKINDDLSICIRAVTEKDIQELFYVINANILHLNRWIFYNFQSMPMDGVKRMVDGFCKGWQQNYEYHFVIEDMHTQRIIGYSVMNDISHNFCTCNIGYWLIKRVTGKGLMHIALAFLSKLALENINLARVEIITEQQNLACIASLRKCPFFIQDDGLLKNKINLLDLSSDAYMFSLTKNNLPEINQFLEKYAI